MTASFPLPTEPASDSVPGAESSARALTPAKRGTGHPDGAETLRADLVALIVDDYEDTWSRPTAVHAGQIADAILAAGFVRAAVDVGTVERIAAAIAKEDGWFPWDQPAGIPQPVAVMDDVKTGFRALARAAVRALREAGEQ